MSMIPLDDLLPSNDRLHEPPNSGDFFNSGTAFWEFADDHKWLKFEERTKRATFRSGYLSALFQCALLSGRSFMFPLAGVEEKNLIARAEDFGRKCRRHNENLVVSGHDDRTED
jgi:hypothetical protein